MKTYILRYGELALKGKNRRLFESRLINNITSSLKNENLSFKLEKIRGRMFIHSSENREKVVGSLKKVFGLTSVSPAVKINFDELEKKSLELLKGKKFRTFRVSCLRVNKNFPKNSQKIKEEIGALIVKKFGKKVDLKNFDLELGIEIYDQAFIFTDRIKCFGGLPLGTSGNIFGLIEDKNSILASWLMMKRGCQVTPVSLKRKKISLLKKFHCRDLILIKNLKEIDKIALKNKCKAVVIGQNIKNIKNLGIKTTLLRPLVGFSQKEINEKLKEIR